MNFAARFLLTFSLFMFTFDFAYAQSRLTETLPQGTYGIPQGDLILRDSPPGYLFLKGNEIGRIPQGLPLIVEERQDIRTLFGNQEWIRVRPANPSANVGATTGWLYNGQIQTNDGLQTPYVEIVPSIPSVQSGN